MARSLPPASIMFPTRSSRVPADFRLCPWLMLLVGLVAFPATVQCAHIFRSNGALASPRFSHTATVLADGKVLIAGGTDEHFDNLASTEIYDPETETSSPTGSLSTARSQHTATVLPNHKVLVTGNIYSADNELFDPSTGSWTTTSPFLNARGSHTATLLSDGKVLVVGGRDYTTLASNKYTAGAEIYDPSTGVWTATGSLATERASHTSTLLQNGKVLVVGGSNESTRNLNSAEIFDPATGVWTATGDLSAPRINHTATLLANGEVLVVGSYYSLSPDHVEIAELYDPKTGLWTTTGAPAYPRSLHTATLLPDNTILVSGGEINGSSVEIYHPETGTWSFADSLTAARTSHTASLLGSGTVLITGGTSGSSAEIYDTIPSDWLDTGLLKEPRQLHSTTVLKNGKVLVAGGMGKMSEGQTHPDALAAVELYDPLTCVWESTGSMATARSSHHAILLASGKVLAVGNGAEIYDPQTGTWSAAGSFPADVTACSATLLKDGTVLATGGFKGSNPNKNSFRYQPSTNSWSATGSLSVGRAYHAATLLRDGKVFVHGGIYENTYVSQLRSSEIYDPASGIWSKTANSSLQSRSRHMVALLPSGKLLVSGGKGVVVVNNFWSVSHLTSAEIYDPATATWTSTGPTADSHVSSADVTLADGRVMIIGGNSPAVPGNKMEGTNSTEIYDEAAGAWTPSAPLLLPRTQISGALLHDGRVLVAGGLGPVSYMYNGHFTDRVEILDPVLPKIALKQPTETDIPNTGVTDFGKLASGGETSLQFTIRNAGTANLSGLGITIDGVDGASFSVTEDLSATEAAPGDQVVFTVSFAPVAIGTKNATLHISNDSYSFHIRLCGSSYLPSPEITVFHPAKTELKDGKFKKSFGTVKVGKSGEAKTFIIKNTGTANLTKLAVIKNGNDKADFLIEPLGKSTLAPGASAKLKVTFNPSAKGPRNAAIHIKSNDADESPFDITVTGMGAKP